MQELNCLSLHLSSFSYFLSISPSSLSLSLRCELLCCLGSESQREAGVVDIDYESPFQQLTCDYDAYIRSWDLRLSPRYAVRPSSKLSINTFFSPSYSRMYKLSMYCGSYCMAKCTATNIAHASIYIIKLFIPAKHYDLQRSVLSRAKMRINVTATSYTSIHVL